MPIVVGVSGTQCGIVPVFRGVTQERKTKRINRRCCVPKSLPPLVALAATIAHELNNPLAAISNLHYLIETSDDLNRAHEYAKIAWPKIVEARLEKARTLVFRQLLPPTRSRLRHKKAPEPRSRKRGLRGRYAPPSCQWGHTVS